ncbi:uncharacterized protein LOC132707845 [Cylas formicarius]|uniref:uncharacterized protein LOC132707845 n=1 Tax=Cylas formicarius TaxID=197179 RepID=UPI002958D553|nr:uncharacterized protein LOC132707845 [Cylas formicarius]
MTRVLTLLLTYALAWVHGGHLSGLPVTDIKTGFFYSTVEEPLVLSYPQLIAGASYYQQLVLVPQQLPAGLGIPAAPQPAAHPGEAPSATIPQAPGAPQTTPPPSPEVGTSADSDTVAVEAAQ